MYLSSRHPLIVMEMGDGGEVSYTFCYLSAFCTHIPVPGTKGTKLGCCYCCCFCCCSAAFFHLILTVTLGSRSRPHSADEATEA